MRIAILHTRLRIEERLLADALIARGAVAELIDLRTVVFDPRNRSRWQEFDLVLELIAVAPRIRPTWQIARVVAWVANLQRLRHQQAARIDGGLRVH